MFLDRNVYAGNVAMTIYTTKATYAANFPIAIDLPASRARYRSVPIPIANPSIEPLDSVDIDYDGTHVPGGCVERLRIEPYSDATVDDRTAYATLDPARRPIALSKKVGETSPLTCKSPYADAAIDGAPAPLEYPVLARVLGQSGTTLVEVTLAANGTVTRAAIYRSSGSSALDRAAVNAAVATHYRSTLVRCEPQPGSYLFEANFSMAR
jgi:TonB family protein